MDICAVPFFSASSTFDFMQETSSFDFQANNIAKAKARSAKKILRVSVEVREQQL